MNKRLLLAITHLGALVLGFGLGVYLLPILSAPAAPGVADVQAAVGQATFHAQFRRDLKGSDALHWGEGRVSVGRTAVAFDGKLAPGPAYKLYLVPRFVETKEDFLQLKAQSVAVGDVKTFDRFVVPVPGGVDVQRYDTVVVWCEAFSMFITAARYR
jgi:hypothetical protein